MSKLDDVIRIARSRVGIKESPPNSNKVDANTWYYGKEVSGSAYPWCITNIIYTFHLANADNLILKSASSSQLMSWFQQRGQLFSTPKVGDIAFFKWGKSSAPAEHGGIVVELTSNGFLCVEGNTSGSNTDANGGMVMLKTRKLKGSGVVAYGRPNYGASSSSSSSSSTSKVENNYKKGVTYVLQEDMRVRVTAGGEKKLYSQLTADGKKHAYADSKGYGIMRKGTRITCMDSAIVNGKEVWVKSPSGWICGKEPNNIYIA